MHPYLWQEMQNHLKIIVNQKNLLPHEILSLQGTVTLLLTALFLVAGRQKNTLEKIEFLKNCVDPTSPQNHLGIIHQILSQWGTKERFNVLGLPIWSKRISWNDVIKKLKEGAERANLLANQTLLQVKTALQQNFFP